MMVTTMGTTTTGGIMSTVDTIIEATMDIMVVVDIMEDIRVADIINNFVLASNGQVKG